MQAIQELHRNSSESSTLIQSAFPPEILAEIFCRCLSRDEGNASDDGHIPTTLSGVCRAWRRAAHDTASLWTRIDLNAPTLRVRHYLELSKSCTLQVRFESSDIEHAYDRFNDIGANVQWTCDEAERWESLSVATAELEMFMLITSICAQADTAFQRLHRLKLAYTGGYDSNSLGPVFEEDAPFLQDVILRGLNPNSLLLPLSHVTTFCLSLGPEARYTAPTPHVMNTAELRELLSALSCLETLILKGITVEFDSEVNNPLQILTLRTLSVVLGLHANATYPVRMCAFIDAPNLETLRLLGLEDDRLELVLRHYVGSPAALLAHLREFDIRHHQESEGVANLSLMGGLLSLVPSIQHLVLRQEDVEAVLDERERDNSDFLPLLNTISFHCNAHEDLPQPIIKNDCLDVGAIRNLIDRQLLLGSPLQKLRFLGCCLDKHPELKRLQLAQGSVEEIPKGEWGLWSSALKEPFF